MMELFPQPQPAASTEGTQQPPVGGPRFTPAGAPAMPGMSRDAVPAVDPMNGMHTTVGNLDFGFDGSSGASATTNPHPDADWHELWQEEAPGFEELMPGASVAQAEAQQSPYASTVVPDASGYGVPVAAPEAAMNPIGYGGQDMGAYGAPQPQPVYEQQGPYAPDAGQAYAPSDAYGVAPQEQPTGGFDPMAAASYGNPSLPQPGTAEWQQWSPQPDFAPAPQGYVQAGYAEAPSAEYQPQGYAVPQPGAEYAPAGYGQDPYAQQQYAQYAPQPEPHVTFGPAPQEAHYGAYSSAPPVYEQPAAPNYATSEPVYTPQPEQLVYAESAYAQAPAADYGAQTAPSTGAAGYDGYTQAAVDAYYAAQAAQQQQVDPSQVITSASLPQTSIPMEDLSFLWYPQQFQSIQTETLQWVQFDEQAQQIRFQPLGQVMLGWYVEPIHQQKIPVLLGQTGLRCTILKVLNPEGLNPSVEGARLRVVHLAIVNEHPAFQIAVQDTVVGWALINELGMLFYDTPVLPQHLA